MSEHDPSDETADDLGRLSKKELVERALAAGVEDVLSRSRAELEDALRER